jgi:glycosyltransferase involved in cell wall biosynthesis
MACNRPIVATNVGDIEWLFGNEQGHFLSSFEPQDVAEKIIKALKFAESEKGTTGRKRIIELKLDSDSVAKKIIRVYQEILKVK